MQNTHWETATVNTVEETHSWHRSEFQVSRRTTIWKRKRENVAFLNVTQVTGIKHTNISQMLPSLHYQAQVLPPADAWLVDRTSSSLNGGAGEWTFAKADKWENTDRQHQQRSQQSYSRRISSGGVMRQEPGTNNLSEWLTPSFPQRRSVEPLRLLAPARPPARLLYTRITNTLRQEHFFFLLYEKECRFVCSKQPEEAVKKVDKHTHTHLRARTTHYISCTGQMVP